MHKPVEVTKRKEPSERTKYLVWGAAAGRCTICNKSVLDNDQLGVPVPIGELAHNIGATSGSPRGKSHHDRDERALPDNLLLVCRNCHKPIDDDGHLGRWTEGELRERKRIHEERVRRLTAIGADQATYVVRMVGMIRGSAPELSTATVLDAATAAGFSPQRLPEAHYADVDLDLRGLGEPQAEVDFCHHANEVKRLASRIHEGVRREAIARISVFAIARIALLVQLGASLDDKIDTRVFQRHRFDGTNAWSWPSDETTAAFETVLQQDGTSREHVVLVLSLSGTIGREELPAEVDEKYTIYEIRPTTVPQGPRAISSAGDLAVLEGELRDFLARVEAKHGKIDDVDVFPAIGVASAVTLGRVLMPQVSPSLTIHERDDKRRFFRALKVRS